MAKVDDAIEFMREAEEAESDNRNKGLEALKFRYGDQWPAYAIASRALDRPKLVINETNTYVKKVTNAQRQQRPRGKASPVDDMADPKIAKVISGMIRHIEINSDADNAYDTAFDFAATTGWGYWRLRADYISEDSRYQDIFIDVIDNPFCVYFDPNSKLPDGSDSERALITDIMSKKKFKLMYPGAEMQSVANRGTGDTDPTWVTEHDIRIAEYYYVERQKEKLVYLTDGKAVWADEMPKMRQLMAKFGIGVQGDRDSFRRTVKWCKQTAYEILETKVIPGRYVPVVPVYWTSVMIDGKRILRGLVWDAMDPQRMVNFWQTSITESLALAPKPKWLMAEGADEGHEVEWKNANTSPTAQLRYKSTGVDGREIPPPQRIAPEPPPAGAIEASFLASQNLSRVMGIFDPAVRGGAQHKSDKTLNAEQGQSESTNFDGYDNLTRSMKHTCRIILGWIPTTYDTKRVQRIVGDDGKEDMVTLNEKAPQEDESGEPMLDAEGKAIQKVLNDVTVGTYDVVMETGPGYDTKRKEGVAAMMELMNTPIGEKVAATADDLIVRAMDVPGADVIADRLAAANPLSQIDEKSDIPPKVQMAIKSLQQQNQQLQQQLQAAGMEIKFKAGLQQQKDDAAMRREHMKAETKVHDINTIAETRQHDVEARAVTSQNVAEINGIVALLLKHIDTHQLEREITARNDEQQRKADEQTPADQAA